MRASLLVNAIVLAAAVVCAGCDFGDSWADSARFKEDFHFTEPLGPGGRVSVESLNGSIEVVGWDRNEVEIAGTKYASSEELLDALEIDVVGASNFVQVRTVRPSGRRGNMGAAYRIRAPHDALLDRIQSSNGSLKVEDFQGDARLRTSNGKITVIRLRGNIDAETSNGSISLTETDGSAVLHTSNGSIEAQEVMGRFNADTSNGSIKARLAAVDAPVEVHTSNGSITLTLDDQPADGLVASTSNASITLNVPSATAARIVAHTSNAHIRTEFEELERLLNKKKTKLEGELNGGGPEIRLGSSNGAIKIQRSVAAEI